MPYEFDPLLPSDISAENAREGNARSPNIGAQIARAASFRGQPKAPEFESDPIYQTRPDELQFNDPFEEATSGSSIPVTICVNGVLTTVNLLRA